MQNYFLIFLGLALLLSCNSNDDSAISLQSECQGVADFAPPGNFVIELVDINGTNLIENGFYNVDQITAKINNEFWNRDIIITEKEELRNLIILSAIGNEGKNDWFLNLIETDVDTLSFDLSFEEVRYLSEGRLICGSRPILNSASYNGVPIDLEKHKSESLLKIPVQVLKPIG